MKDVSIDMKGYVFDEDWKLCSRCVFFDARRPHVEYCEIKNMVKDFKKKRTTQLYTDMMSVINKCGNSENGIFKKETFNRRKLNL